MTPPSSGRALASPYRALLCRALLSLFVLLWLGTVPQRVDATCAAQSPATACYEYCPNEGTWRVEWTDQSNCGCDEIIIYQDLGCTTSYSEIVRLTDCSITEYVFCAVGTGTEARFKIVYLEEESQTVNDIVTNCTECP